MWTIFTIQDLKREQYEQHTMNNKDTCEVPSDVFKKTEEARWHVMSCRRLRHNRYNCQTQNIWHDCKNHIMYHQQRYTSKRYVESWSGVRGGRRAVKHVPRVRQNISIQRKPLKTCHIDSRQNSSTTSSSLIFRTDWSQAHFQWLALTCRFDFTKDLDYRLNLRVIFTSDDHKTRGLAKTLWHAEQKFKTWH